MDNENVGFSINDSLRLNLDRKKGRTHRSAPTGFWLLVFG
jgi:hypothetical protein